MEAQQQEGGEETEGQQEEVSGDEGGVTTILDLDVEPIRLDLLGLVLETEEIHVTLDAESGDGKLVGNLVNQLSTVLNTLDLSGLSGQITETAQNTLKGLAGEASSQVQEKGSELIRSTTSSAVESLSGYLQQKVPGMSGQGGSASQGESRNESQDESQRESQGESASTGGGE